MTDQHNVKVLTSPSEARPVPTAYAISTDPEATSVSSAEINESLTPASQGTTELQALPQEHKTLDDVITSPRTCAVSAPRLSSPLRLNASVIDPPTASTILTSATDEAGFRWRTPSTSSRTSATGLRVDTSVPYIVSSSHPSLMASGHDGSEQRSTSAERGAELNAGSPGSYFLPRHSTPLSPSSASLLPSPALSAAIDLTPLPSPLAIDESSPRRNPSRSRRLSRNISLSTQYAPLHALPSRSNSVISNKSPKKPKPYTGLVSAAAQSQTDAQAQQIQSQPQPQPHGRHRSISDFVPEALFNVKQRVATFGHGALDSLDAATVASQNSTTQPQLHREANLASRRGVAKPVDSAKTLPSPPPSNVSEFDDDDDDWPKPTDDSIEFYSAVTDSGSRRRKWRSVKQLGEGTFSKVMLATSERLPSDTIYEESKLDKRQLVAVKIIEHGPAGGADEDRIKHSLSREIEILKSVRHPSLVHLVAHDDQSARTYLVLRYCPGGDLFEFASRCKSSLTPSLVQRMFAELVGAVHYLHQNWIVHRDIKLESAYQ